VFFFASDEKVLDKSEVRRQEHCVKKNDKVEIEKEEEESRKENDSHDHFDADVGWHDMMYSCVSCEAEDLAKQKVQRYKGNPLKLEGIDRSEENFICKKCWKMAKKNGGLPKQSAMDKAVENFLNSCDDMPCFVCTCCHRVLFGKSVRRFKQNLYSDNADVKLTLSERFRFRMKNGKEYICNTCHSSLRMEMMPCQAVANNLEIPDVPQELSVLSHLEMRCISLRIPFMKICALRKGGQGKIDGPCVNVPAKTDQLVDEVLPRVPEDLQMIMLKLKRRMKYKSHHIFDYIRPVKVMEALMWLKTNNPFYADVRVDSNWFEKLEDDPLSEVIVGINKKGKQGDSDEKKDSKMDEDLIEVCDNKECQEEVRKENVEDMAVDEVISCQESKKNCDRCVGAESEEKGNHYGVYDKGGEEEDTDHIDTKKTAAEEEMEEQGDHTSVDDNGGEEEDTDQTDSKKTAAEEELEEQADHASVNDKGGEEADTDQTDSNKTAAEEELEEQIFLEEQEELDRKALISVEPSTTCLQMENPDKLFEIAPGENCVPRYILLDDDFEQLSFPHWFPFGTGGYQVDENRSTPLDLRRYINQRLLNVNGKFSQSLEYIFAFQYACELKQLRTDMCMALRKVSDNTIRLTAGNLCDNGFVQSLVFKDLAYKFMKNVRGTPAYWQGQLFDTLAMLRTYGTPTFFLTLSAAEFLWPQFIKAIGRRNGVSYSNEDIEKMSWNQKAKLLRGNPVVTVQMFQHRLESFFSEFLLSDAHPLGKIKEYCIKIEFQARGSPHGHCLIWTEDAPQIDKNSDAEVEAFCDKYLCGTLPDESEENFELRELVERLQTHRHSSFCRKTPNDACRFNFPRPPVFKNIVARSKNDSIYEEVNPLVKREVLKGVRSAVEKNPEKSIEEVLSTENIEPDLYVQCLQESKRGATVILQREPCDMYINNYNPDILGLWKANMDLQYVADPYSAVMYVLSYVLKSEKGMSELLKQAAKEYESGGIKEQMKQIASAFSNKREVSIQEAVMRVLSCWLFKKTTQVIYVSNVEKDLRTRMPKPREKLRLMRDDDTNVFLPSIHDRYEGRPDSLENMCLAEFATNYVPVDKKCKKIENVIQLKDDLGMMRKRKKPCVMRTHRHADHTTEFYYGKLLLFFPWRNEKELKSSDQTFQERYNEVFDIVEQNAKPFNLDRKDIDAAFNEYMEHGVECSDWDNAVSKNEEETYVDKNVINDGDAELSEVNENKLTHPLISLYKTVARKKTMEQDDYYQSMQKLNYEQRQIVDFNRRWIKQQIVDLKRGKPLKGYKVFLSGPGGTGKSTVIRLIHRDITELFRSCHKYDDNVNELEYNLDDITSLLSAFTGTAAFNINGSTLHSLFQLMNNSIPHEKKTIMMVKLRQLKHLTIDEISMVKKRDFDLINERCAMVRHEQGEDMNFGGIAVLAVGDLYQLPPVCGMPVFSRGMIRNPSDMAPLLWDKFVFHELKTVMRQKDDYEFAMLLNEIRLRKPEENSIADQKLKARSLMLSESDPDYPRSALHVYARNINCRARNERMLSSVAGKLFRSKCRDSIKDEKINLSNFIMPDKATQTGNLEQILMLKEGARVMLTNNLDVKDGLTNGAFGVVKKIITRRKSPLSMEYTEEMAVVLVQFDAERVGRTAIASSAHRKEFPKCVPIYRTEVQFNIKGSKTIQITRKQFPLTLAWAVTIHKTQGMTVNEIVVDMTLENGRYSDGQAYVALSRVTSYEKLHIINYNRHQIKVSATVEKQMLELEKRRLPMPSDNWLSDKKEEHIVLTHLNLRGFCTSSYRKREDLLGDVDIQQSDIVCLTETHLHPLDSFEVEDVWLSKQGNVYRQDRSSGEKGGGIVVVVRKDLPHKHIQITTKSLEVSCVQVKSIHDRVFYILCIYIRPKCKRNEVHSELQKLLTKCGVKSRIVLVGDMNDDISEGVTKMSFLRKDPFNLQQWVAEPTTDYGSLLDHMYTCNVEVAKCQVKDCYFSDHDKTMLMFK